MKHVLRAALFLLASALPVSAESYPIPGDKYVNDLGELLTLDQEDEIRAWLKVLDLARGLEVTLLTVETMQDYGHSGEIEPFATGLFNTWGIGNARRNDGVLVLVARDDRQMRIELGAGYPKSWDAKAQVIIEEQMLPAFRKADYASGLRDGTAHLIKELTGSFPDGYPTKVPDSKFMLLLKSMGVGMILMAIIIFGKFRPGRGGRSDEGVRFGGGRSSGGGASGRW